MKIVMAQINTLVGDIKGNTQRILDICVDQSALGVDMVVFPELTLTGYPPEDLLLRQHTTDLTAAALERLCRELPAELAVVVGYPRRQGDRLFNSAGVLYNGTILAEYDKQCLPNYQVFDEKRYFEAGADTCVVTIKGLPIGLTICEDIWHPHPAANAAAAGAQVLINLNASPFHRGKQSQRTAQVSALARTHALPILYVNQVGGQDELVFDGGSFAVDARGDIQNRAIEFAEVMVSVEIETSPELSVAAGAVATPLDELEAVWHALVLGMRDYVEKNGFPGVVLGLSGGIDSAVTLAVAVDALGPERVEAVMMPFRYTASMSIEDAAEQANNLGVSFSNLSIEPLYDAFMTTLAPEFQGLGPNITEENLQARCRGVLLMSISNKKNLLVLTTGNKSELAVGYSTLYGDMAGGFDALKDCPKMLVYALARYRNTLGQCIPERVITRPPSAELAPDQKDEDSLPPYEVLDQIIEHYVERDASREDMITAGFAPEDVQRVVRLIDLNEYKRRQAPVGVRISPRAFGRDRRYPITWAWQSPQ
ncbi:NAD+ synthase [Luminiphilus sp.]|jgi:NAD+ synthase (glutamine-hydrolysing)|nr:NAD+ synthase [Luminiphilus sp.]